ncbi:MAG: VCBS repeat-containing protein [Deltaproteobacteria bacterium]|nr:VCBS repeat-containing protein [Deltaproteobacteria bacterium]
MRTRSLISVCLCMGFALVVLLRALSPTEASPAEARSGSVLILPFHVISGQIDKTLKDFSDHADRTLRSSVDISGTNLRVEAEDATRKLLEQKGFPSIEQEAVKLGIEAGSSLVVFGVLSEEEGQYRLNGVLWDIRKERMVVRTDLKVANIHGLPTLLQIFVVNVNKGIYGSPRLPFYRADPPEKPGGSTRDRLYTPVAIRRDAAGPWRSPELAVDLRAVDIADVDGDKKNEAIFLDAGQVTVSRFEEGSLRTLFQFSQRPADYISVEAEDLNGDGMAEVILCYQTPSGMESAIFHYADRSMREVAKFPHLILATVADPTAENKRILLGQRTDRPDVFSGEMIVFRMEGQDVTPVGKASLPPGALLLSYASGRLGGRGAFFQVMLSQDQRLMVFDEENRLLANMTDKLFGVPRALKVSEKKGIPGIIYPGRVLIADTDGDGENEVLVAKQTGAGCVIEDLLWDGTELKTKWKTVGSQGIIPDFRIRDLKNAGNRSLVVLLVSYRPVLPLLTGPRSVVFAYDILP